MRLLTRKSFLGFAGLTLLLGFAACNRNSSLPVAPVRVLSLTVSVPIPSGARASLLGASSNEILYNLSPASPGAAPVTGKAGPFASSSVSGTIDFTIQLATGSTGSRVLALQLNDATTHSPLAIGAGALNLSGSSANITVQLGSVIRNCYFVSGLSASGASYTFDSNQLSNGVTAPGYDISVLPASGGFRFADDQTPNSISLMGNGDFVNFAYVPAGGSFMAASPANLAAGDIYCVKLNGGGYAWVQVSNPGTPGVSGPSFRFRVNHTLPYYAYDPTTCDFNGRTPTATLSPTITYTPTITPTIGITNITANIDGIPVTGNTSGGQDNYSESISIFNPASLGSVFHPLQASLPSLGTYTVYNYGLGAPDLAYQFTLSSPKSLFISLCGASFDTLLYVRTNPNDPSTTINFNDDSNSCGNGSTSSSLTTGILQPGTYYVIVDGYQSGEAGTFSLSLSTFNPSCSLTPVSTPIPEVEPNNDDMNFTNATDLGMVLANGDSVGKGHSSFFLDPVDTWHFHAGADGAVYKISLDCFDDGTGKAIVGFDLYSYNGSSFTLIDSSNDNGEPNQVTDTLAAGDYYVAIYAIDSGASEADYHLVVQAGSLPTPTITDTPTTTDTPAGTNTGTPTPTDSPTNTPSQTPTFTVGPPANITGNIDGAAVAGDTTGLPDQYNDNGFGAGSSDIAYYFVLSSPKSLLISLCGSTGSLIYPSLYVRTNPNDPNTDVAFDEYSHCPSSGYLSQLVTGTLQAGVTYYVIVDGWGSSNSLGYYGTFNLNLTTFTPACSLTPLSTPVNEIEPNNDNTTFSNATNLGTVSNGTDAVGVGHVNHFGDDVDVWKFHAGTDMGIDTISLDCFDDLNNRARVGFDIYDASFNVVAVSSDGDPLDQVVQVLPAGDYYIGVYAFDPDAPSVDYRLVIQGGPASTSPTPTPTITPTVTNSPTLSPTLTISPTPPLPADITSSIDGAPVTGNTTGLADNYNQFILADSYTYGSGSPDVAYKFTLSAPKNLYIVANTSFSGSLYLRTNPSDPSTTFAFDQYFNYIDGYPALVTGTLPAGTYYVIVDGHGSGNFGTFSLALSTFTPSCALTPVSSPVTEVEPNNDPSFLKTTFLGTVSNGMDAVGKGKTNYYFDSIDNWHFKTGTNGGTYVVSLDCFDDGTGKNQVQFQLYNSHHQSIGSSSGSATLVQYNSFLPTGDYYVKVSATNYGAPSGDYHLVIQGFPPPTATPTPTVTNTPTTTPTPLTPMAVFGSQGTGLGYLVSPFGIAVNSAGTTVYVSDYTNNYVQIFTGGGSAYTATSQWGTYGVGQFNFYNPIGLALDSSGNIYVVDSNNSRVQEYNSTGTTFLQQFGFFNSGNAVGSLVAPQNVTVDVLGNVYVTQLNASLLNREVAKYNSGGTLLNYWDTVAGNPVPNPNPYGIAADSTGTTLYLGDINSTITAYSNDGSTRFGQWNGSSSGKPFSSPRGIAVAPSGSPFAGNLYVADDGNGRIVKFDANGNYMAQLGGSIGSLPGQFSGLTAVAIDGTGNVYVLDTGNYRVQKLAPF